MASWRSYTRDHILIEILFSHMKLWNFSFEMIDTNLEQELCESESVVFMALVLSLHTTKNSLTPST